jgi:hypothetical protein
MRKIVFFILLLALTAFTGCGKRVIKKSNLVCGDDICDPEIGETVETCPRDCQPSPHKGDTVDSQKYGEPPRDLGPIKK